MEKWFNYPSPRPTLFKDIVLDEGTFLDQQNSRETVILNIPKAGPHIRWHIQMHLKLF